MVHAKESKVNLKKNFELGTLITQYICRYGTEYQTFRQATRRTQAIHDYLEVKSWEKFEMEQEVQIADMARQC